MKQVAKKKLGKNAIALIALCSVIAFLIAIYFIVVGIAAKNQSGGGGSRPPELLEGEGLYLNVPTAYPSVREKDIISILVVQGEEMFDFTRLEENGSFWIGYGKSDAGIKEMVQYIPPVAGAEGGFDYESLYAVEENDGYGRIYLLTYLCSAIGTPIFDQRILLPTGTDEASREERAALIEEYGVSADRAVQISFVAEVENEDGETENRHYAILLGDRPITNKGFYYRIVDYDAEGNAKARDCIYYTNSNYFEYALGGVHTFVKGMLVSEGLASDSAFEPYLTTDFKSWVNEKHEAEGDAVLEGSKVIAFGKSELPVDAGADYTPGDDGYERNEGGYLTFDLAALKSHRDFERIKNILTGLKIGEDYTLDPAGRVVITLTARANESDRLLIDFSSAEKNTYTVYISSVDSITSGGTVITKHGTKVGNNNEITVSGSYTVGGERVSFTNATLDLKDHILPAKVVTALRGLSIGALEEPYSFDLTLSRSTYEYTVTAVEAVLDGSGEISAPGTPTAGYEKIKITYTLKIDGRSVGDCPLHAVLDLSEELIPPTVRDYFATSGSVGALSEPLVFEIAYSERSSLIFNEKLVVREITNIFSPDGRIMDKVDETSFVSFIYYETVNGVRGEDKTANISLSDVSENPKWAGLVDALVGKGAGTKLNSTVYSEYRYYEPLLDFTAYEIEYVDCFITSEIVASFRYVNASERDPYFGESFFENTLNNEYKLYGLNASACEGVVRFFGGIAREGSSSHSEGLSGKTVALGLTHENMEKYGLYAHTVYFELPRGIYEIEREIEDEREDGGAPSILDDVVDYAWYGTLGFTLYISAETVNEDGQRVRYIGSDMYDLIAEVDATDMYFLDMTFVDFYARRNIFLTNLLELKELDVEFFMEDVYGSYDFDIRTQVVYLISGDGYITPTTQKPEAGVSYTKSEQYIISAAASADSMPTYLKEYLTKNGKSEVSVSTLYNYTLGGGNKLPNTSPTETVGVSNFRTLYHMLLNIRYQDTLSEEEQSAALRTELLMRLKLKLRDEQNEYYVYDFYRIDDRRVMVSLYKTDSEGNEIGEMKVQDFYMTTFSFKTVVLNFVGLFNGCELTTDIPYPDYPEYEEK